MTRTRRGVEGFINVARFGCERFDVAGIDRITCFGRIPAIEMECCCEVTVQKATSRLKLVDRGELMA